MNRARPARTSRSSCAAQALPRPLARSSSSHVTVAGPSRSSPPRPHLSSSTRTPSRNSTGNPVRSQYRKPGEPRSEIPAAIIVAPATYNTINKWAQGISDTYALGILAETTALDVPIVVLPFVNTALAGRQPFRRSVEALRAEGVRILLGPGGIEPHPPHTGGALIDSYPWHLALDEADRLLSPTPRPDRPASGGTQ